MNQILERLDLGSISPITLELFQAIILIIIFMVIVGMVLRRLHVPRLVIKPILGLGTVILFIYLFVHYSEFNFN